MKDLPLKPLQSSIHRTLLPQAGPTPAATELKEPLEQIAKNAEASVVSVPRTKSLAPAASDAGAVLESFLSEVRSQKDVVAAHGGLDASRVFDLLSDED